MIGRDRERGTRLRANRLEMRVDNLEAKLAERRDEIARLRESLRTEEDRVRFLKQALADVEADLEAIAEIRDRLEDRNLTVPWLPDHDADGTRPDRRLAGIRATLDEVRDAAEHLVERLDGDRLAEPTDAADVLGDRIAGRRADEVAAQEAPSVLELYRLWTDADPMDRYRRELLAPYARAAEQALDASADHATVEGARLALDLLQEAFEESRTYMLRRSAALDDHVVDVRVRPERFDRDPGLALERLDAVVEQARARGAVDFFHNLAVRTRRAVEGDVDGADQAAWLVAEATAAILSDPEVEAWIASGIG